MCGASTGGARKARETRTHSSAQVRKPFPLRLPTDRAMQRVQLMDDTMSFASKIVKLKNRLERKFPENTGINSPPLTRAKNDVD
ncbi:hypothetical protein BaRGS_00020586 [Batillaria attramentaria]|uniref:Uncharacterized protein n=1 Tax=Batillaria attramentaria TaxID=370345 RepID=A0ABD0KLT0_9CAEN